MKKVFSDGQRQPTREDYMSNPRWRQNENLTVILREARARIHSDVCGNKKCVDECIRATELIERQMQFLTNGGK